MDTVQAKIVKMHSIPSPDFSALPGDEYLTFHKRRYAFLLETIRGELQGALDLHWRFLDVGPAFQTPLLRAAYPNAKVDTAGFVDRRFPARVGEAHFETDLNSADQPDITGYDLIVMAEVLEHLYAPPTQVLTRIRKWLKPGGLLILQTPNPVSLGKRIQLLGGHSPFEIIREHSTNPGHFCEYTVEDLSSVAKRAGFEVADLRLTNYFGPGGFKNQIYNWLCLALPGNLQDGITAVLRKPKSFVGE